MRTGGTVAKALGWSPAKISRYELGQSSFPLDEVEKLLDFYEVTEPRRGQLLALAEEANQRGWWEDYADALTPEFMEFIGLEAEADTMAHWQVGVVPGLLQTEEYARRLNAGYQSVIPTPPGILERLVRVRMIRKELLTRDPPLQLSVVIDEAVLLRKIGDRRTDARPAAASGRSRRSAQRRAADHAAQQPGDLARGRLFRDPFVRSAGEGRGPISSPTS